MSVFFLNSAIDERRISPMLLWLLHRWWKPMMIKTENNFCAVCSVCPYNAFCLQLRWCVESVNADRRPFPVQCVECWTRCIFHKVSLSLRSMDLLVLWIWYYADVRSALVTNEIKTSSVVVNVWGRLLCWLSAAIPRLIEEVGVCP